MTELTYQEILIIVTLYIGVTDGYLGDFSYRTHAEFYPVYCNLDIDPYKYEGTTREKFITILKNSPREVQAKILAGVLQRFPYNATGKPSTRTEELYNKLLGIVRRLEGASPVSSPEPQITSAVVEQAINDAEILIQKSQAVSGVDRVHTALHGYLHAVCDRENITYSKDDTIAKLFKTLRQHHPAFQNLGTRSQDIERVLHSFASIMDALNPIRNNASIAHPNEDLLGKPEAMLVINVTRTLLHYLDMKIS